MKRSKKTNNKHIAYILHINHLYKYMAFVIVATLFVYLYFIMGAIFNTAIGQNMNFNIARLNSENAEIESQIFQLSKNIYPDTLNNKTHNMVKLSQREYLERGVYLGRAN